MPVAVVGMHRSGTSLLAQILHRSGLYLGSGDRLLGPGEDNPEGFWEHTDFSRLNEALLQDLGGAWDDPPASPTCWTEDDRLTSHVANARELLDEFSDREPWGWKDPRTSVTLPLWLDLIPDLKVIHCVRNPLEVAFSLQRRNLFSYSKAVRLWKLYNERVLATPVTERIVVSYERVLSNPEPELARVLKFIGLAPGARERRDVANIPRRDLRHISFGMADLHLVYCHPEVIDLYARLGREAGIGDEVTSRAPALNRTDRTLDEHALKALVELRAPPAFGVAEQPQTPGYNGRNASVVAGSELMTGGNVQVEETVDGLKNSLRVHLAETLRVVLDEHSGSRDLLGEGLIDSMAVMELVAYIEETFGVIVEDEEIIAENFRSLDSMVSYVVYKKTGVEIVDPYVASVREFVAEATPVGAFVLLLSSGDDRLLQVSDRIVWPFPCDEEGAWGVTGHPADGGAGIVMVERLCKLGATHIVFLAPELWWLDYYPELRTHLERGGGPAVQSPLGVAYALSDGA
jgi:acyl carrier protein